MAKNFEIYKCELCGNIVEVLHGGPGKLFCCGKPMVIFNEKLADQGKEKHLPVLEKQEGIGKVKVGDIAHPMTEKHYIEWIEIKLNDGIIMKKFLDFDQAPEAIFNCDPEKIVEIRSFCNLHGLWKTKI